MNDTDTSRWDTVTLDEVVTLRRSSVHPSTVPEARYVGLEHIDSGVPVLRRWGRASDVTSTKSQFCSGDVLFGKLRPYLDKSVLAEADGVCSTDILVLSPGKNLRADYLSFMLHSTPFLRLATETMQGTNHPRTKWSALSRFEMRLPSLLEQNAIASILQGLQEAIQARRSELGLELERKAAVLNFLLTYGTRGQATTVTEVGEMPSSWRVVRLGEVVGVKGGKRLPKGSSYTDDPSATPYIRVTDFKDGSVDARNIRYIDDKVRRAINRYTISKNDVYISIAGTIGLVGTIPPSLDGANLTENAAKLVIRHPDQIDNRFLSRYLATKPAQRQIEAMTMKTSQPKLALMRIEEVLVGLPSLEEQHEIETTLSACDRKVATLEWEVALHEELFQALLEELMSGKRSARPLIATKFEVAA